MDMTISEGDTFRHYVTIKFYLWGLNLGMESDYFGWRISYLRRGVYWEYVKISLETC